MSKRLDRRFVVLVFLLPLAVILSCSFGPSAIKQPSINASRAGKLAMEMYDKNGDGKVDGDELENAPSLKSALQLLDKDGDGAVSADEVAARVQVWKSMKTSLTGLACTIKLDGQPLADAKVTFEPEAFLGDEVKPAVGTTNSLGMVGPSIPKELKPDPKLPGGAHFGLYKVRISKVVNGKETIPAKFNSETILGQEVSYDQPDMIRFDLKSK